MPRVVVFDCESDGLPSRGGAVDEAATAFRRVHATVTCALAIDVDDDGACDARALARAQEIVSWRDTTPPLVDLLAAFDDADLIVGYNVLDFDFPLLRKHYGQDCVRYREHRMKTLDPFHRLRAATCEWPKLDRLLAENGLATKTSSGKVAIQWWEQGERKKLRDYCMQDVYCTARLALLPTLRMGGVNVPAPIYAIRAALAALSRS